MGVGYAGSLVEQSFTNLYMVSLCFKCRVAVRVCESRTSSLHRAQAGKASSSVHFFCCGDLGDCHLELEFLFHN